MSGGRRASGRERPSKVQIVTYIKMNRGTWRPESAQSLIFLKGGISQSPQVFLLWESFTLAEGAQRAAGEAGRAGQTRKRERRLD